MIEDILPACDLCYSKKIKCDRQRNCANCADARVACRRLRPRRTPKQRVLLGRPEEKLLRLEPQSTSPNTPPDDTSGQEKATNQKRKRIESQRGRSPDTAAAAVAAEPTRYQDNSTHHAQQARLVIQNEIDSRRDGKECFSDERWKILQSAVKLVDKMSRGEQVVSQVTPTPAPDPSIDVPSNPPAELLFMFLPEPATCSGPCAPIRWPDHITDETFQRMMAGILSGDCQGQAFHQSCVCVYVKAIFHLYQLARLCANPQVKKQLRKSKRTYEAAALQAIEQINVMSSPSLLSIQSFISAALLMQHISNMGQCWLFTSYAARQIVSLKYHETIHASHQTGDIQNAVCWCFYLDRTISALLFRHPSLPELRRPSTDCIPEHISLPYNALLRVLLDLAEFQGALLDITLIDKSFENKVHCLEVCHFLQDRMPGLYAKLEESRNTISGPALCDWIAADFCYFAILVDILRTRLRYDASQAMHVECLLRSRQALRAFRFLQEHLDDMPGFSDPEPSFLTWTVSLYPASPFFVLFCNMIGTSDVNDYQLIQQIIDGLSRLQRSPYLMRLLSLLTSLQRLCEPLFQDMNHHHQSLVSTPITRQIDYTPATSTSITVQESRVLQDSASFLQQPEESVSTSPFPMIMADDLMWQQLFNSHLPLGWFSPEPYPL